VEFIGGRRFCMERGLNSVVGQGKMWGEPSAVLKIRHEKGEGDYREEQ